MGRGPSYPYVDLEQAVGLTKKLYDYARRNPAPLDSVVRDAWSYSPTSSSGQKVVAALKAFGLLEEVSAPNGGKAAKITDSAYRILVDDPQSPQRREAIKAAALSPRWYGYCWKTWGAEMPPSMRSNLLFEHGFVESTVDAFIRDYKKSIAFAGLKDANPTPDSSSKSEVMEPYIPKIGDYVQWESQGVMQFKEPLRVRGFSEDGKFAFVETQLSGLPLEELIKEDHPPPAGKPAAPIAAPGVGQLQPQGGTKMLTETFVLSEGSVTIQWPSALSPDSFEDFKDWLQLLERRVKRSVKAEKASEGETPEQE
jgi:hypothetical protein